VLNDPVNWVDRNGLFEERAILGPGSPYELTYMWERPEPRMQVNRDPSGRSGGNSLRQIFDEHVEINKKLDEVLLNFLENEITDECLKFVTAFSDWRAQASQMHYYNSTVGPWNEMPLNLIIGGLVSIPNRNGYARPVTDSTTLGGIVGINTGAMLITGWDSNDNYIYTHTVLLGNWFFGEDKQTTTLFHEYLHSLLSQNDSELAKTLTGKDYSDSGIASAAIQSYISKNCYKESNQ
jgi:hypothetical protein